MKLVELWFQNKKKKEKIGYAHNYCVMKTARIALAMIYTH